LPLSDSPQAERTEDYVFWLAGKGCHIHALAVVDIKSFEIPVLGTADGFMPSVVSPPVAESQALLEDLTARAQERLDRFARNCAQKGFTCSAEVKTGIPGDVIAREAVAHDVVVMSRSGYARPYKSGDPRSVDPLVSAVIRACIRPVMVAGKAFPRDGGVRRIMAAFDGSTHAARALAVAAELSRLFGIDCHLVTISPTREMGEEIQAPAEAFLYHHGVAPKKQIVIGSRASELLCDVAGAAGTDILVMGAYGHSPIREMFFGCTTERVLSHCDATVILQS
jgi:nucleotide-binding universal stress UspA family protein